MAAFRKLKLVSEEELERLKQKQLTQYDPHLRLMARVQNQVENLLSTTDPALTANERLRLLEMLQQRFRDIKGVARDATKTKSSALEQVEVPPAVGAVAQAPAEEVLPEDIDLESEVEPLGTTETLSTSFAPTYTDTILSTISTRKREEARSKLIEISKHPSILTYNHKLEAVINGTRIPDSNFIQLFHTLYTKSSDPSLIGRSQFQNAIANIELTKASASLPAPHSRSRSALASLSLQPPPGTSPDVLRVYSND